MGVYSNKEIRKALLQSHIVCRPLVEDNIRGSSVDMTMGEWYYVARRAGQAMSSPPGVYNPFDEDDVKRYFAGPFRAEAVGWSLKLKGIAPNHPVIMLLPGMRILAHSHEFIGIHPPGTSEMRARSSWGRNGISVCLCAGWGDPGYINRWTWEVVNFNDEAVPLPVGERMAQMIFHTTGDVDGHYGDTGKYQSSTDIDEVISQWDPVDMLPRSYNDERRTPLVP